VCGRARRSSFAVVTRRHAECAPEVFPKCDWCEKPQSAAMLAIDSFSNSSSRRARCKRRSTMYACGVMPSAAENPRRNGSTGSVTCAANSARVIVSLSLASMYSRTGPKSWSRGGALAPSSACNPAASICRERVSSSSASRYGCSNARRIDRAMFIALVCPRSVGRAWMSAGLSSAHVRTRYSPPRGDSEKISRPGGV
jgi:hypothetical protein